MRRTDKEITDQRIIEEILTGSQICRLGLVENGEAYIVPVNYAYSEGYIYAHSASEGRKVEILKRNPVITFEIEYMTEVMKGDIPCKSGAKYRSVMGKGTVEICRDREMKKHGFNLLIKKYGIEISSGYDETALASAVLLKLKIESVSGKQSGTW